MREEMQMEEGVLDDGDLILRQVISEIVHLVISRQPTQVSIGTNLQLKLFN